MGYETDFNRRLKPAKELQGRNPYLQSFSDCDLPCISTGPVGYGGAPAALEDSPAPPARRPVRVIHIVSHLFGAGIENWMVTLVRYSDPTRIQFVRCIVTNGPVDQQIVARLGIPVAVGQCETVRQAAQDADILLVSGPGAITEWLADIPHPPIVFVAHGDGPWTQEILDSLRPKLDHVVAVSNRVLTTVCDGVPTTVIHNSVDPAHLTLSRSRDVVRASLGFGPDDFVLGYVGRFSIEKNPVALVEAIALLPHRFKSLLVGHGWQRYEVLDQALRQIPCRFAVVEAHEYLGDYYLAMDAHCLPSVSEGYGLVVMEAMLCGCPVISAPVGFAPESLTNRVNGIIVDGSPASFAEAAILLHAHPKWREAVAAEGQKFAQRYGLPQRMTSKYADVLEAVFRQSNRQ